jgi:TolB protein
MIVLKNRVTALVVCALGLAPLTAGAKAADAVCLTVSDGYWQVATLDVNSGRTQVVTHSAIDKTRVSWFPNGRLLVNRNDGTIETADPAGGTEQPITLEQRPLLDAVVSPDGTRIAFSFSTAIDGDDIWVLNWPSRKVARVLPMPAMQHEPAWSADGATLYFLSGGGGQSHDIWRYTPDTQAKEQLTVDELYHFDVAAGPDGEIAYSSNRDGNYEIYVRQADGISRRLTNDPALDARPNFSPDGKTLLFESSRSGAIQVFRMDVATGNVIPLTSAPNGARQPVWRQP